LDLARSGLGHFVDFFSKPFQRLADTLADLRQTARSENDQHDDEDDNEFRETHCAEHGRPRM
jgi:hypothetical protein